jgi:hypothetical protein
MDGWRSMVGLDAALGSGKFGDAVSSAGRTGVQMYVNKSGACNCLAVLCLAHMLAIEAVAVKHVGGLECDATGNEAL